MSGSAPVDTAFLLVEHPGPWGNKALAESDLPEHVRRGLAEGADRAGVRVQLIRRHGRVTTGEAFRVFLGYAAPGEAWLETTVLGVADDLLDLDLDGLAEGRLPGLEPHNEPLLLVCTNGKRDACCAEFGRPVVTALADAFPQETWETTHLGGHRFAATMLVLPHGLSYGRIDPEDALRIADLARDGRLDPQFLRGRTAYVEPVQAAEIALLEYLGDNRIDALALVAVTPAAQASATPEATNEVTMRHDSGVYRVVVEEEPGAVLRASCLKLEAKPTTVFRTTISDTPGLYDEQHGSH